MLKDREEWTLRKSTVSVLVIGALVVILFLAAISSYNGLVSSETKVDSAYSEIDNQLQRRYDLIPNLVNTVKGYAEHEKEVMQEIASAREKLGSAGTLQDKANADAELTGALNRLLVVVENYPNLKADAEFTRLMDELAGTENRIAVARRDYNSAAETYNVKIRKYPTAIFAGLFGFDKKEFFRAQEGADQAPEVKF